MTQPCSSTSALPPPAYSTLSPAKWQVERLDVNGLFWLVDKPDDKHPPDVPLLSSQVISGSIKTPALPAGSLLAWTNRRIVDWPLGNQLT